MADSDDRDTHSAATPGGAVQPSVEAGTPEDATKVAATPNADASSTQNPDETDANQVPRLLRLGRYEVQGEIARGGMGAVYRAYDPKLDREVALKVMLADDFWASEGLVERFLREARAAARLHHPNLVPIFDVGQAEGKHYYAMELIEGESLTQRVEREGPLDPRVAAEIGMTLARAIHHAHANGIIHRDLKPSNVLAARDGRLLITDFGLAKELAPERHLTQSGAVLGTPAYMAPEQARGEASKTDARTDVYGLGAVLYHLVSGVPPFNGETAHDIVLAVRDQDPLPLRARRSAVPVDLDTIVMKCLEKPMERRYTSALALAQDLERVLAGEPILARPVGAVGRLWRRARRNRAASLAIASLVVVVLATSGTLIGRVTLRRLRLADACSEARRAMSSGSHDTAVAAAERAVELADGAEEYRALLRQTQAGQACARGEIEFHAYQKAYESLSALRAEVQRLRGDPTAAGPHRPGRTIADEEPLWKKQVELRRAEEAREGAWQSAVGSFTQAYGYWNGQREAMDRLADLYWGKYVEADELGNEAVAQTYAGLVRQFGPDRYGESLRGARPVCVAFSIPPDVAAERIEAYLYKYERNDSPPVLVPVPCNPRSGALLASPALGRCDPIPLSEARYARWREASRMAEQADENATDTEAFERHWQAYLLHPGDTDSLIRIARSRVRKGATEEAMDTLAEAIRRGLADGNLLRTDEALKELRRQPRFEALLSCLAGELPRRFLRVKAVNPGGRLDGGDVSPGDVVLSIGGEAVSTLEEAGSAVARARQGQTLALGVWRYGGPGDPPEGRSRLKEVSVIGGGPLGVDLAEVDLRAVDAMEPSFETPRDVEGAETAWNSVREGSAFVLRKEEGCRVALAPGGGDRTARLSLDLPKGSYLLHVPAQEGLAECRYPFLVAKDVDWSDERAELPSPAAVPPGFLYIPEGPYEASGDPDAYQGAARPAAVVRVPAYFIGRMEVTTREYLAFLNDRSGHSAAEAVKRAPRLVPDADAGGTHWRIDESAGTIVIETLTWIDEVPVMSISHADMEAFAEWKTRRDGDGKWKFRLPTEDEWEKAARGVDGRHSPCGNDPSITFFCILGSRSDTSEYAAFEIGGLFPLDEGPYGARDMAGVVSEWTTTSSEPGGLGRTWKGGGKYTSLAVARCASRSDMFATMVSSALGFRLAAESVRR